MDKSLIRSIDVWLEELTRCRTSFMVDEHRSLASPLLSYLLANTKQVLISSTADDSQVWNLSHSPMSKINESGPFLCVDDSQLSLLFIRLRQTSFLKAYETSDHDRWNHLRFFPSDQSELLLQWTLLLSSNSIIIITHIANYSLSLLLFSVLSENSLSLSLSFAAFSRSIDGTAN